MEQVAPPDAILQGLHRMGLIAEGASVTGAPLTGGVSSDIWRIDLARGPVCVKRALPKLRVAADWQAPVDRNIYEARWMRRAAAAQPGAVPALLGQDPDTGTLAMDFLAPGQHPNWKLVLRDGVAEPEFAAAVGKTLARIHAATAADPMTAGCFPTDAIFYAIRLEPYLIATARVHPDRADALLALAERTQNTKLAMVHGDVSPKNILVGPAGPVFLDAECAWWGDPAFDLAFCLNHLLLKCLWNPAARVGFLRCFESLSGAYLKGVNWEPPVEIEQRTATLLPGLMLARVDGKSPVEYLTDAGDKTKVRRFARALLLQRLPSLHALCRAWREELES
jgi:aminoglycoside phosphotransferase (APT) family kinase protein